MKDCFKNKKKYASIIEECKKNFSINREKIVISILKMDIAMDWKIIFFIIAFGNKYSNELKMLLVWTRKRSGETS